MKTKTSLLGAAAAGALAVMAFGPQANAQAASSSDIQALKDQVAALKSALDQQARETADLRAQMTAQGSGQGSAGGGAMAAGPIATAQSQAGRPESLPQQQASNSIGDVKVAWKGAPEFDNPTDNAMFKFRGRLLVDSVFQKWNPQTPGVPDLDTREFRGRQAFIGVEGRINDRFAYKVEGGWVNGGTPSWDDAVVEFKPSKTSSILFGNAKSAGLENLTSTRFLTFMERGPYANVAGLDYNLGVVARYWGANWSVTGAVQGDSLNTVDVTGKETLSETGRATFAPINTKTATVHVGAWYRHRDHGDEALFGYTPRPSTNYIPGGIYALHGSGAVGQTDNTFGLEGLGIYHQFSVQGEYVDVNSNAPTTITTGDVKARAGYLEGSVFFGGHRTYAVPTGEVSRPKIDHSLGDGGWGAIQLAARYDFANIDHSPVAGDYDSFSLGLNYYPNAYTRFMIDYTDGTQNNPLHPDPLLPATYDDIKVRTLQMRAQIDW